MTENKITEREVDIKLKGFIENIEKNNAEIKVLNDYNAEILKTAKSVGFDTRVCKRIIALRKLKTDERLELETMTETYKKALGMENID